MHTGFSHRENAFTLLRYLFAFSLIVWHFSVLTRKDYFWPLTADNCVQGFFILSGFLTMVSFERPFRLPTYVKRRFCRTILPYTTAVMVCFAAGAVISTLSMKDFFSHPDSLRYLLCNLAFLNFLQPDLPGVFDSNPLTDVNGALWSMKVELLFYCTVPVLHCLFKRFRPLPILTVLFLLSIGYNELFRYLYDSTKDILYVFMKRQIPGQYVYFCGGMMAYYLYDYVKTRKAITAGIVLVCWSMSLFINLFSYINTISYSLLLVFLAYRIPLYIPAKRLPNLTYGIYLYHFPVIQIFVATRLLQQQPVLCFLCVTLATLVPAWAAHRWIEQPLHKR